MKKTKTKSCVNAKPMRSGIVNSGYEYENLLPAYFALQLLQDENIKSFILELNSCSFEKFNDFILTVTTKDDNTEYFAVQLKHREKGRDELDAKYEFYRKNKNKGKYFNIEEYSNACRKNKQKQIGDYNYILFTNVTFSNYEFEFVKKPFHVELFDVGDIYIFREQDEELFYLISKQKNLQEVEAAIDEIFTKKFHSRKEIATLYKDFFRHLRTDRYNNTLITRDDVILHLTRLLLSENIIPQSLSKDIDNKIGFIEEAIRKFDLTILTKTDKTFIEKHWKCLLPSPDLNFTDLAKEQKLILKEDTLENETLKSIIPFILDKPLFLHVTENSEKTITFCVSLLKSLEKRKVNLVLISKQASEENWEGFDIFKTLRNLITDQELHEKFVNNFKVSLQGREATSIATLKKEFNMDLEDFITPNDLFQFLEKDLLIGKKLKNLPEFYIERSLVKPDFLVDNLNHLSKENTVVIHCGNKLKSFSQFLREKELKHQIINSNFSENDIGENLKGLVLTDKPPTISLLDNYYYHLELIDECNTLRWLERKIDPASSKAFTDQINILCGDPGSGTTAMMTNLTLNCPNNYWVIVVPLNQVKLFINVERSKEKFLEHLLQQIKEEGVDQCLWDYFIKEKKFFFFFDGLHKLNHSTTNQLIHIIKQVSKAKYKVWVSCTKSLKIQVMEKLNVLKFYELNNISKEEQWKYLCRRLKNAKVSEETIQDLIKKIIEKTDNQILRLPLNLYILTEIIRAYEDFNEVKETFTLDQMYQLFFKRKLQHSLQSTNCHNLPESIVQAITNYYFKGYQIVALNTCFEKSLRQKLRIEHDTNFYRYIAEFEDFVSFLNIDQNENVYFFHHTFAEYFAAMWLVENYHKIPLENRSFVLKPEYEGVRKFFDLTVTRDCALHFAILNDDLKKVKQLAAQHIEDVDKVGRSPLHLAASTGKKHLKQTKTQIQNSVSFRTKQKCFSNQEAILKYLLNFPETDLYKKDKFLGWNSIQYAHASLCLFALEELAKKTKMKWNDFKNMYKDSFSFTYYCVTMGYINLLQIAISERSLLQLQKPYKNKSLLHLALIYNQEEIAIFLIKNGTILKKDSQNTTPLQEAAIGNLLEAGKLLLNNKTLDIEAKDKQGRTALHFAARLGHTKFMELLLNNGADINATDKESKTPLHKAAYGGKLEAVQLLLNKGANIEAKSDKMKTPLHRAAAMGHFDVVKCLIEHEADIDAIDNNKKSSLHFAAGEGHETIVEYLIDKNVNVFLKDEDEKTARDLANQKGHQKIVKMLAKAEEKSSPRPPSASTENQFHAAADKNDLETIKKLLSSGSNTEEVNSRNETVLHIASSRGYLEMVEYLVLKGNANTAAINNDGRVPLHLASQRGHLDVVKLLLNKGQNSATDNWGHTSLHRAAYKGHEGVVSELLKAPGTNVNCCNNEGGTALHSAARGGHIHIMEYLIEKGADYKKKNSKMETCLHVAVQRGCTEVVDKLTQTKPDIIDVPAQSGRTALSFAVEKGYRNMVEILIKRGADVTRTDELRKTPLDIAKEANRLEIYHFLKDHLKN